MVGHRREGVSARHYTDYLLALDTVRESLEKLALKFFPDYSPVYVFSKAVSDNAEPATPSTKDTK